MSPAGCLSGSDVPGWQALLPEAALCPAKISSDDKLVKNASHLMDVKVYSSCLRGGYRYRQCGTIVMCTAHQQQACAIS